jgi:L-2,4-diaminobutyrate decarboxylase
VSPNQALRAAGVPQRCPGLAKEKKKPGCHHSCQSPQLPAAGIRQLAGRCPVIEDERMREVPEASLDQRSARLCKKFDPQDFARSAGVVTGLLRSYLQQARSGNRPVLPATAPEDLLRQWPHPEDPATDDFQQLCELIVEGSTSQHHPGFVGQQLSAPPPLVGPLAMIAAILNNSVAIYEGAPVGTVLEKRIVSWMAEKAGYGREAGGVLTSGGTLGALTAMLAMRQAMVDHDVWQQGWADAGRRLVVLVPRESHYCNRRACAILGFGEAAAMAVPVDSHFRIDVHALPGFCQEIRAAGRHPVALIANACSTATGSYDNLLPLADFCQKQGLWFHVDAAHGGGALLSPRYRKKLQGIERADSIVWDAHKMLQMPGLCTAVLFRHAKHLQAAFRQEAAYLKSDCGDDWCQTATRNFETTKPVMALPLYVTLRILGAGFLAECVEYACDLAASLATEIERRDEFELLIRPESNIVCFRRRPPSGDLDVDALQMALRQRVNRRGRFFLMRTTLRGNIWLRVVLMNPATRMHDLRDMLDELAAPCEGLRAGMADQVG